MGRCALVPITPAQAAVCPVSQPLRARSSGSMARWRQCRCLQALSRRVPYTSTQPHPFELPPVVGPIRTARAVMTTTTTAAAAALEGAFRGPRSIGEGRLPLYVPVWCVCGEGAGRDQPRVMGAVKVEGVSKGAAARPGFNQDGRAAPAVRPRCCSPVPPQAVRSWPHMLGAAVRVQR